MTPLRTLSALALLTLLGCISRAPVQTTFDPAFPERNSAGDSIAAVFEGRIPCADQGCEMRKVELVLYGREAGSIATTYWLGQLKVGLGNDRLVHQGNWTARRGLPEYPNGTVYELDSGADPSLRHLWRVSDDVILVLDQSLRPLPGTAAWGRMLSRDCTPYGPRSYPYDVRAKRFAPEPENSCAPPGRSG
jgi:hypothetical protein